MDISNDDESSFYCKKCKNTNEPNIEKKRTGPLECEFCDYKTNTKFNLQRHVSRKHEDGVISLPEDSEAIHEQVFKPNKSPTLKTALGDVGLDSLTEKFEKEGIDIKLLLDLKQEDLRRMLKDLDVNWGDRYKIEKQVEMIKHGHTQNQIENVTLEETATETFNYVTDSLTQEVPDTFSIIVNNEAESPEEDTDEVICNLCNEAAKQERPQHKCRKCAKVVCNLFCSIKDPESDNDMHRIHKRGDVRCIAENSETYSSQSISFDCPKCNDVFSCNAKLQSHMA